MAWLAAIAKGGGQAIGTNQERKGLEGLRNAYDRNAGMFQGIEIPDVPIEDQKMILEMLSSQGELSPELLQALELGPSAMEGTFADQGLVQDQGLALDQMQEVADQGLTEADMAAAREIARKTTADDSARRKSILNDMAMRGTMGSGAELAAQLDNVQKAEQSQAVNNDRLLQEAQARKLQAIAQSGQMAGQMRGQDYGEKSDRSRARDVISQFNTQNRQRVMDTNVGNKNSAQQYNLTNKQNIADKNVGLKNNQQQYNKELLLKNAQQKFQNEMAKTGAIAGQNIGAGQAGADRAKATSEGIKSMTDMFGGMFGGMGTPSK